ncbi:MAG: IS30 family transposase [bacterium]|nr:IS30 family transposase [bacterium]
MKNYHRLTLADREEISRGLGNKESLTEIAKRIGKDKSAISQEVNRDGLDQDTYRAHQAHGAAQRLRKKQGRKRKIAGNAALQAFVHAKLKLRWSPQQIVQFLKKEYAGRKDMQVSHEAIYTYLYVLPRGTLKKELLSCLRQQRKYRRKRKNCANEPDQRGKIPEMISIEARPKEVAKRTVPGHWEGDLLLGKWKQSALGTLGERTTRTTLLVPLSAKDAITVRRAFSREMKRLPQQMKRSMTYDQGREMVEHKLFTRKTKVRVYFAHPGSPWERGTNENTNGLVRQFFPKGTDFNKVSRRKIKYVQHLLNGRPRKVLNWQIPYEVFNKFVELDS